MTQNTLDVDPVLLTGRVVYPKDGVRWVDHYGTVHTYDFISGLVVAVAANNTPEPWRKSGKFLITIHTGTGLIWCTELEFPDKFDLRHT